MQTLYQAANAVEAHMIMHLLKQQGITGHVLGEHLQGAMGELPAAGLVRVMVEEDDYPRGRQLIAEWEASMPHDADPASSLERTSVARRGKSWTMLLIGVAIGVVGTYGIYRVPARQQAIDHNGDGAVDETWTSAINGAGIGYEADRNFDGKPDYVVRHGRGGVMTEARLDEDFDGVMETRLTFVGNQPEMSETDTDADGYADYITLYKHGVVDEVRYLNPATAKPLRVEHVRLGKVLHADVDTDMDGVLDARWRYGPLGEVTGRERLATDDTR